MQVIINISRVENQGLVLSKYPIYMNRQKTRANKDLELNKMIFFRCKQGHYNNRKWGVDRHNVILYGYHSRSQYKGNIKWRHLSIPNQNCYVIIYSFTHKKYMHSHTYTDSHTTYTPHTNTLSHTHTHNIMSMLVEPFSRALLVFTEDDESDHGTDAETHDGEQDDDKQTPPGDFTRYKRPLRVLHVVWNQQVTSIILQHSI